jgi:hypothetical protein
VSDSASLCTGMVKAFWRQNEPETPDAGHNHPLHLMQGWSHDRSIGFDDIPANKKSDRSFVRWFGCFEWHRRLLGWHPRSPGQVNRWWNSCNLIHRQDDIDRTVQTSAWYLEVPIAL